MLICIGNTGCGKSTLLAALIYGPQSMKQETLERELDGQTSKRSRKSKQQVIECTDPRNVFKIGHSTAQSETFIPNIYYDEKTGITFSDVAGFNDTSGELIEIVNNFVIKYILQMASKVRFLLPVTLNQITEARGSEVRGQLDIMLRMNNAGLEEMGAAI